MNADQSTADAKETPRRIRNIIELAELAGVSPGTVSRALTGKGALSEATRERIKALASEHGFRLNQMASRLRTQRTGLIGVVIPLGHASRQHVSDPFFMTLFGALADELTETGHDIMLKRVVPDDADWLERIVDSGMLDGTIVVGQSNQLEAIDRVARRHLPVVVWGKAGYAHCTVGADNVLGGELAVQRLIDTGRRKLAFLGDVRAPEIADRLVGALATSGAVPGVSLQPYEVSLSQDEMPAQIAEFVARHGHEVDGVFCSSDVMAMVCIRILRDAGLRVPEDVAVVGFDNLAIATQTSPPLTTVNQKVAEGAHLIVKALMARIEGEAAPSQVLKPELVIRESA
jgi:DNA-binding LacI/PurR family transcriptional regulator